MSTNQNGYTITAPKADPVTVGCDHCRAGEYVCGCFRHARSIAEGLGKGAEVYRGATLLSRTYHVDEMPHTGLGFRSFSATRRAA